jgi:hypothetical protein
LKKSMTNIASECRSANIVRDHATILPDDATPKPDAIFGKDKVCDRASPLHGLAWLAAQEQHDQPGG